MAKKLSDAELGARVRAANRIRAVRQRERLVERGKVALTTWVTANLRDRLQVAATRERQTIGETISQLLEAGLTARDLTPAPIRQNPEPLAPPDPAPDTLPLFEPDSTEGESPRPVSVDAEIARLVAEGKSWAAIADELNTRGFHTATGARFHKGALHRLWAKQQERQP